MTSCNEARTHLQADELGARLGLEHILHLLVGLGGHARVESAPLRGRERRVALRIGATRLLKRMLAHDLEILPVLFMCSLECVQWNGGEESV